MYLSSFSFTVWEERHPLQDILTSRGLFILAISTIFLFSLHGPRPKAFYLNPRKWFEFSDSRPKREYVFGLRSMLWKWFQANPNKAASLVGDVGDYTVLPPSMANEIRSDKRLSFSAFSSKFFLTTLPGFEAFHEGTRDSITLTVINRDITKYLSKVTQPLADETSAALEDILSKDHEWKNHNLHSVVLQVVSRISARVFLGEELCRNEAWLKIIREYAVSGMRATDLLRPYPAPLRHVVHWFVPECQKARAMVQEARKLMKPIIENRRALKAAAEASGKEAPVYNDAIAWFEAASKGTIPYDPAISQLFLSTVAIHTTTDLMCQTLIDIARNPDILEPLREEIANVLRDGGWKKTSLYNMHLLDSVVKESQRMKPLQLTSMQRYALDHVELSDGTIIPKNTFSCVSSHALWDPNVYENPERWDGYRFAKLRKQPGKENSALLVTTSDTHLGFGHGKHACPGRFFAANEIKIALAHLLLQYDWKLPDGEKPEVQDFGSSPFIKDDLRMEFKRRSDEKSIPAGHVIV